MRIPTVQSLASAFDVSTITVRRAVRDLRHEGLLAGRQGRGLFVVRRHRIVRYLQSDGISPIEEDMRRSGVTPAVRDLRITLQQSDHADLPESWHRTLGGSEIYRLDRVLLADNEAVALDVLFLPRKLYNALRKNLQDHFVVSLLEDQGFHIDHLDYALQAATATPEQASLLSIEAGFPMLVIKYRPIGANGVPLLVGRTSSRADRFSYHFSARPNVHSQPARGDVGARPRSSRKR